MNRTDRLTAIILALQHGRQTAGALAERFEVSRRTILRDIDALCEMGIPVVSLPGAGGGLELDGDHWLKPIHLSRAEAVALLLATRSMASHSGAPFAQASGIAIDKLRAALQPEVLAGAERDLTAIEIAPSRHAERLTHFALVQQGITAQSWLRITYQSLNREAIHVIRPNRLREEHGFWYCTAISLDAGAERQFRLDRILAAEMIAEPQGAADAMHAAAAPTRAYDDPSHPEVVVRLTYRGAKLAEDEPHYGRAVRQIAADRWELRFRCPPGELTYCARLFFGYGPDAEVVAPPSLRAQIHSLALEMARLHDPAAEGDSTVSPLPA